MAWLKDLARSKNLSLPAVARRIRKLTPKDRAPKEAHLSNMLRKADAGETAWWLDKGAHLTPLLAQALEVDEQLVLSKLQESDEEGRKWLRFPGFERMPPVDLTDGQALPSAFTNLLGPLAFTAFLTRRHWVRCEAGWSSDLLSRYLQVNLNFTEVVAETWDSLPVLEGNTLVRLGDPRGLSRARLDAISYPFFLVVVCAEGLPEKAQNDEPEKPESAMDVPGDTEASQDPNTNAPAGIAAGLDLGWHEHHLASLDRTARSLFTWVSGRVEPGGKLRSVDPDHAVEQLTLLCSTIGDALQLMAHWDEVGLAMDLSRETLVAALARVAADHGDTTGDSPARDADLLLAMFRERLRRRLTGPLPARAWEGLIPEGLIEGQASDVLRQLAKNPGAAAEMVKKLLERTPEGCIAQMRERGLLRGPDEALELEPPWIRELARELALQELTSSDVFGLGAALLEPQLCERVLESWITTVADGDLSEVEMVLESADPYIPEEAAALDGAFRACGLALLQGHEVDDALLEGLWHRQMDLVRRPWANWPRLPLMRIGETPEKPTRGTTHRGAWWLSALAISEALKFAERDLPTGALNPWGGKLDDEAHTELSLALGQIVEALNGFPAADPDSAHELLSPARGLAGRILDAVGLAVQPGGVVRWLMGPDALVAASQGEVELTDRQREDLLKLAFDLKDIEDAAARRDTSLARVLHWCWQHWKEGTRAPKETGPYRPPQAIDIAVWGALTPEHANLQVLTWLSHQHGDVLENVQLEVWMHLAGTIEADSQQVFASGLWPFVPWPALAFLMERIGVPAFASGTLERWWDECPNDVLALLDREAVREDGKERDRLPVFEFAARAPPEHAGAVLDRFERWVHDPDAYPGIDHSTLIKALAMRVQRRGPGWPRAWPLLRALTAA